MMRRNDFKILNKMLELVAHHHKAVEEQGDSLKKAHSKNDMNRKEHKSLSKDYDAYRQSMATKIVDIRKSIKDTSDNLKDFQETKMPLILEDL